MGSPHRGPSKYKSNTDVWKIEWNPSSFRRESRALNPQGAVNPLTLSHHRPHSQMSVRGDLSWALGK